MKARDVSGGDFATINGRGGWIAEMRPETEIRLGPVDNRILPVSRVDGTQFAREFGLTPRSFEQRARQQIGTSAPVPSVPVPLPNTGFRT